MTASFDSFLGKLTPSNILELADQISERQFTAGDAGISARIVTHWDSKQILSYERQKATRKKEEGWRYFDFVEFFWLLTVRELRDLGQPIALIKEVKAKLFEPVTLGEILNDLKHWKSQIQAMDIPHQEKDAAFNELKAVASREEFQEIQVTTLFLVLVHMIQYRKIYYLIIFSDNDLLIWTESESENFEPADQARIAKNSQIRICLTEILKKFLTLEAGAENAGRLRILSDQEIKILEVLRDNRYKSVTVHFKAGRMTTIELKREQLTSKRIVDILAENKYQRIEIVQHNGEIARIENIRTINIENL